MNARQAKWYTNIGVTLLIVLLGVSTCYGPPKFWRSHVGWRERDVIASLGKPTFDSRVQGDDRPGETYTLGWYHGWGMRLALDFDASGVVVEQSSDSK